MFFLVASLIMPPEFVDLKEALPQAILAPRYATHHNFVGSPLNGYLKETVILTQKATNALAAVAHDAAQDGFRLVIYDGYRPQKTIDHFLQWAKATDQKSASQEWYFPRLSKRGDLFKNGYIARHSSHSRGSTVDLTLIKNGQKLHTPLPKKITLTDGTSLTILDDGTIDMGTSFDFMDKASNTKSSLVTQTQKNNRLYLRSLMERHGFCGISKEWWHFTLINEPFPTTIFNFPVK